VVKPMPMAEKKETNLVLLFIKVWWPDATLFYFISFFFHTYNTFTHSYIHEHSPRLLSIYLLLIDIKKSYLFNWVTFLCRICQTFIDTCIYFLLLFSVKCITLFFLSYNRKRFSYLILQGKISFHKNFAFTKQKLPLKWQFVYTQSQRCRNKHADPCKQDSAPAGPFRTSPTQLPDCLWNVPSHLAGSKHDLSASAVKNVVCLCLLVP
jgi:hypothetical protein